MYLMTEGEREIFIGLRSKAAKEQFTNLFWQKRDPDLTTYDNEYKIEFEKRVAFTNRYFSTCNKKGWKSDRGKVYVLLGPPTETEIERNPVKPGEPKSEVWIYHNIKTGPKFKNSKLDKKRQVYHYRQECNPGKCRKSSTAGGKGFFKKPLRPRTAVKAD